MSEQRDAHGYTRQDRLVDMLTKLGVASRLVAEVRSDSDCIRPFGSLLYQPLVDAENAIIKIRREIQRDANIPE